MLNRMRFLIAALTRCALLLTPMTSASESALLGPQPSSAELKFRIKIPQVMRVLENSHPTFLVAEVDGDWSAQQRLVVVSNMRSGFCVILRKSAPDIVAWRLNTLQSVGITIDSVEDGYRLCTSRAGRYTFILEHKFEVASPRATIGALRWPVRTDITAL